MVAQGIVAQDLMNNATDRKQRRIRIDKAKSRCICIALSFQFVCCQRGCMFDGTDKSFFRIFFACLSIRLPWKALNVAVSTRCNVSSRNRATKRVMMWSWSDHETTLCSSAPRRPTCSSIHVGNRVETQTAADAWGMRNHRFTPSEALVVAASQCTINAAVAGDATDLRVITVHCSALSALRQLGQHDEVK